MIATGSRAFVPPIEGAQLPQVHSFRTTADVAGIATAAGKTSCADVVGGGLLGLEAAAGLLARGVPVTVVECSERLMPAQLDDGAARLLARTLQAFGLALRLGHSVASISSSEVLLDDGERLPAGLVVVAAGVRAETTLAREAGIEVGRGILVDDELRTSAPSVWAVAECAEHRGVVQGLWAPIAEQARVAGAAIAGDPAGFHGATPATTLKVAGVELFAGGSSGAAGEQDEVVFSDTRNGVYRKLVLDGERLTGALLVGDASHGRRLSELLRTGDGVPAELLGAGAGSPASEPASDGAIVCSCNSVTHGEIAAAIRTGGFATLAQVARATRASTGCGSCSREVEAILASSSDRNETGTAEKPDRATIAA